MNEIAQVRRLARLARDILLPPQDQQDELTVRELARADARWLDLHAGFDPLVTGADVLDVTAGDARLLIRLLETGARSVAGLDPAWLSVEDLPAWNWQAYGATRFRLWENYSYLDVLEPGSFDIVLCSELDSVFTLGDLEAGLARIYNLLRPGGEILLRARCADPDDLRDDGPGYGVMTPTGWSLLFLRAGFEISDARRIMHRPAAAKAMATLLPAADVDERECAELRCRLVRPWEAWELATLTGKQEPQVKRRRR